MILLSLYNNDNKSIWWLKCWLNIVLKISGLYFNQKMTDILYDSALYIVLIGYLVLIGMFHKLRNISRRKNFLIEEFLLIYLKNFINFFYEDA